MTEGPHLVAVPEPVEAEKTRSAEPAGPSEAKGGALPWILGVGLVVCALGWAFSVQRGQELEASLSASNQALLEARSELSAYDAYIGVASDRAGVLVGEIGALGERLAELHAMLAAGPAGSEPVSAE